MFCSTNECNSFTGHCYSCIAGYYGIKCDNKCSFGCQKSCNMISGSCLCKHGYYRPNCSLKCSSNCLDSECHQEKGICSACNNGSYGDYCDQKCFGDCSSCLSDVECMKCKNDLYYGKTCNLTCNTACINKTCDIAGYCKGGCEDGKYGDRCDQDCLKHCISCQNLTMCLECEPGYFGISCQNVKIFQPVRIGFLIIENVWRNGFMLNVRIIICHLFIRKK